MWKTCWTHPLIQISLVTFFQTTAEVHVITCELAWSLDLMTDAGKGSFVESGFNAGRFCWMVLQYSTPTGGAIHCHPYCPFLNLVLSRCINVLHFQPFTFTLGGCYLRWTFMLQNNENRFLQIIGVEGISKMNSFRVIYLFIHSIIYQTKQWIRI